jgi:hypothetical protein
VRCLIPKEKDNDDEDTYKINPSFRRVTIIAKNSNRLVSDMLEIGDSYTKFCIDEAADYLYQKLLEEARNENQKDNLQTLMKKYSTRKKK